uniref:Uncharacterized protein n=1 Tax=Aquilaria malaccensis TaxID=223753 RepID=A0A4Y6GLI8_9ROSI|nr:hypothetical protein [Aquilaria malaccensis]
MFSGRSVIFLKPISSFLLLHLFCLKPISFKN